MEPSGNQVYYETPIGDYGQLDVDDVDGFGPEHYIAPVVESGQTFVARVHLFHVGSDTLPIDFTLQARIKSDIVWTETRSLFSNEEYSEDFVLTTPEDHRSCEWCSEIESSTGNGRSLADYSQVPVECTSCMRKYGGLCAWFPIFCDDEDALPSWKKYQNLTKPLSKEMLENEIRSILTPMSNKTSTMRTKFELYLYGIEKGKGDYECLQQALLWIFCKITIAKDMETWITTLQRLGGNGETVGRILALDPIVKIILSGLKAEILTMKLGIDATKVFTILRDYYANDNLLMEWGARVITKEGCGFILE